MIRWSILVALVAGCAAPKECDLPWPFNCNSNDAPPTPPEIEGYEPTYTLTCGYATCEPVHVEITRLLLQTCFTTGTAPALAWAPTTPGAILADCGAPDSPEDCLVTLDGCGLVDSYSEPDPVCVDDVTCAAAGQASATPGQNVVTSPDGHCAWDYSGAYAGLIYQVDELEAEMDAGKTAACPVTFGSTLGPELAQPDAASECNLGVACDPAAQRVWAPASTHALQISSASSWLKLTKPGSVTTIPLSGSLALDLASSGGLHLQAGRAKAPNTLFGGNDHTQIVAGPAAPVTLATVAGHPTWYTVSAAAIGDRVVAKAGMPDPYGLVVRRMHPSGAGLLKLTGSSWTYDYSQNLTASFYGAMVVQVHLAGTWTTVAP